MANKTKPRDWYINANPFEMDDEHAVGIALSEIVTILTRLGGAVSIVADRREIEPGMWATVGYMCRWESYTPGARVADPAPESAEDDEPVEVAA